MDNDNLELYKNIVNNNRSVPLDLMHLFTQEFSDGAENALLEYVKKEFPINIDAKTADSFHEFQSKYKSQQENAFISRKILETNNALVKGLVGLTTAPVAATGVGVAITVGVNKFMDELLDYSLDKFDESVANSSKKLVVYHINKIREQTGINVDEISRMDIDEARKLLFDSGKGIMDNSIEFLTPDDKIVALQEMSKIMEDKLTSATELNNLVNENQDAEISELKDQVEFIVQKQKAYDNCFNEINNNINDLNDGLNNLNDQVEALRNDVDKNSDNIDILKDYVFANADVNGKISLLESGLVDLPKEEKEKVERQLKALQAKKDLENKISSYLNKAEQISTILNNVGFDDETVKKANELVNVGNVAMNAFTAYTSGDVIGAISAVSGLFGKSKPDPAAQRHAQIMNKLNKIEGKIDDLLKGQIEIQKNQFKILESLITISKQINELHDIEMDKLNELYGSALYNRFSNLQLQNRNFITIEIFSKELRNLKKIKARKGEDLNYTDLEIFFRDLGDHFEKGIDVLIPILNDKGNTDGGGIDQFMQLKAYEYLAFNENPKLGNDIKKMLHNYSRLVEYIESFGIGEYKIELTNTVLDDVYSLDDKCLINIDFLDEEIESNWNLLKTFISVNHLKRVYEVLSEIHIFYQLQRDSNNESEILTKEEFFSKKNHNRYGLIRFRRLLKIINIAIAQENLFTGDVLLDHFYNKIFNEKIEQESKEYQFILSILTSNPIIFKNFCSFFVVKQLKKTRYLSDDKPRKFDFFEYALFLNDRSSIAADVNNKSNLRACFDEDLHSSIILHSSSAEEGKRWKIDLYRDDREAYLVLPNSKEFNQGKLLYRKEMYELLELKNKVIDQISNYELDEIIDPKNPLNKFVKFN